MVIITTMIIYASPKTGKSTFCKEHTEWIDSDIILFDILKKKFNVVIDDSNKSFELLNLFRINRVKAEDAYTLFMHWLKNHRYSDNILLGSRRFMWLADKVFLKKSNELLIFAKEIDSANRWAIRYQLLDKNQFINLKLLEDEKSRFSTTV
jgi:hypothetical protein